MNEEKTKHILMITARSDMGGGPKHILQLLQNLSLRKNFRVSIASPRQKPFFNKYQKISHRHITIPIRSFSVISFIKLLFFCKTQNIEYIHSHGRGGGMYSRLLGLWGFKIIHTFHGAHNDPSLKGQLKLFIDRFLTLLTDHFICVSESEKSKALSLKIVDQNKVDIINNGVNMSEILHTDKSDLRRIYKLPKNKKIWGSLTRLSHEKGNDLFLEMLKRSQYDEDYVFIIAGSGPEEENYKKFLIKNNIKNVIFSGEIENPISFLKGLDGFFSFSRGEGLPLSVIEAIACELPCVISDVSGHDQFENQVQLFSLGDTDHFLQLVRNTARPIHLNQFRKDYSEDRMLNETIRLYNSH
jgi:glycosyltransferase involved in cell wall biosynthesis